MRDEDIIGQLLVKQLNVSAFSLRVARYTIDVAQPGSWCDNTIRRPGHTIRQATFFRNSQNLDSILNKTGCPGCTNFSSLLTVRDGSDGSGWPTPTVYKENSHEAQKHLAIFFFSIPADLLSIYLVFVIFFLSASGERQLRRSVQPQKQQPIWRFVRSGL